jgi:hypothetical protein
MSWSDPSGAKSGASLFRKIKTFVISWKKKGGLRAA